MAPHEVVEKKPEDDEVVSKFRASLRFGAKDDTIIIFVPSRDRDDKPVKDQDVWASQALELLGRLYGGATGFPSLVGIWRDDERNGKLLEDAPIMIQSLARRADTEDEVKLGEVAKFCRRMGKALRQGAVGVVFNDVMHFITKYD